jgi:hypothetical protein
MIPPRFRIEARGPIRGDLVTELRDLPLETTLVIGGCFLLERHTRANGGSPLKPNGGGDPRGESSSG